MTHVGPFESSTTVIKGNKNKNEHIYCGSEYLDTILYKYSQ